MKDNHQHRAEPTLFKPAEPVQVQRGLDLISAFGYTEPKSTGGKHRAETLEQ